MIRQNKLAEGLFFATLKKTLEFAERFHRTVELKKFVEH
jgi:hypothetical protein